MEQKATWTLSELERLFELLGLKTEQDRDRVLFGEPKQEQPDTPSLQTRLSNSSEPPLTE